MPGGVVEQVTKGARRLGGFSYDRAFTTMAYTVGRHDAPPDVYVARIDGSGERRLSDVHRDSPEIAFSPTETLKWPSKDGTMIEGWLTRPHGYDRARGPYPLIVFSHGGPHAATGYSFDFKKQFFAANGYFVLEPTSAARRATATRSSGRPGARGATRMARMSWPASTTS